MKAPLLALPLLGLALAGCLGGQPPADDGDGGIEVPVAVPLMGLADCRGTILRFLAPLEAMRPFVHPAFALYEGTDAAEVPGSGTTAVSVSSYLCEGTADAPPGPQGVTFIFARVHAPDGIDLPEPMTYVARFYANETLFLFANARGLPAIPADVTLDFEQALLGTTWTAAIDAPDGAYEGSLTFDPAGATTTEGSGPFLAVTANDQEVTWLVSNITVTARQGQGRVAAATQAFQAYTGGQPVAYSGAIVDPLQFPIELHRRAWDNRTVPPPPTRAS